MASEYNIGYELLNLMDIVYPMKQNGSFEFMGNGFLDQLKKIEMGRKIANNLEEAFNLQEKHEGKPVGWIQWKGTEVCMDVHCKCGHHSHFDGYFCYNIKCPKCGTIYACTEYVELIEVLNVTEQELQNVIEAND